MASPSSPVFRATRRRFVMATHWSRSRAAAGMSGAQRWCCAMPSDLAGFPAISAGTVLTVGTFDGMHRGHARLLERTAETAARLGAASVALTFDPHPLEVVNPSAVPALLSSWDEKLEAFAQTPIDYVVLLPFTQPLAALDAEAFVDRVLCARLGMRALVVGHDHGLGRGRGGDAESLRMIGGRR